MLAQLFKVFIFVFLVSLISFVVYGVMTVHDSEQPSAALHAAAALTP